MPPVALGRRSFWMTIRAAPFQEKQPPITRRVDVPVDSQPLYASMPAEPHDDYYVDDAMPI